MKWVDALFAPIYRFYRWMDGRPEPIRFLLLAVIMLPVALQNKTLH
jgi:hypothetical protein